VCSPIHAGIDLAVAVDPIASKKCGNLICRQDRAVGFLYAATVIGAAVIRYSWSMCA
jgi:hypothetical protein